MKPWLFDILACPMDKHFPLKLYIFSYDTQEDEFKTILENYENRSLDDDNIIVVISENGKDLVKDNVIIQKSSLENYLSLILKSIEELNNISDLSQLELSKKCFNIILTQILKKIEDFSKNPNIEKINEIVPELIFINKLKIEIEIESGLLFCKECMRWFPIIDTIPQMLPDEYRDEKKEIQFLKTKKILLDVTFFKQDLKPFNIP